jgi:hypothetical protein
MPPKREAGVAGSGDGAGADDVSVLPFAEDHDDEREGGRVLVLALRSVRASVERRTAASGESSGPRRPLGLSRGHRKGDLS